MRFQQTTVKVELTAAAGGGDIKRVWADPFLAPVQNLSVTISTNGVSTAVGALNWEVFYGGSWTGTPFDASSTHTGGVSQGSGALAAGEYANVVYSDTNLLPSNGFRAPFNNGNFGLPVVLELENDKAAAITLYVTFVAEMAGDH